MGFPVVFYSNTAENNVVNKYQYLTEKFTASCVLKDSCDIVNPIIILEGEVDNLLASNYVRIEQFNRYYYINNIVFLTNNICEIYLECDVLYTYADKIRLCNAFVERCQMGYDSLVIDHQRPVKSGVTVSTESIPNSLFNGESSILIVGFTVERMLDM